MHRRLPKKFLWLFAIPLAVPVFFLVMGIIFSGPPTPAEIDQKFIVVNPLDLTQIKAFSKYRSCMGHDYRGPLVTTGQKESTPRSMKHYIKVKEEFAGKNDLVKAIAPFDGVISNIEKRDPERTPVDQQIWLTPKATITSPRQWHFVFFHLTLRAGLKKGSQVKAGEVIGTARLTRGPENFTDNFDMAIKFTRPFAAPAIDLPLAHATDTVMAEYANYGVTLNDLVIPKEFRDQNPCPTTNQSLGGDIYFPPTTNPNDTVYLKLN